MTSQELDQFEQEWIRTAEEIVRRIFADPEIQQIQKDLQSNGKLSWTQKSEFIVIADGIKNDLIREKYGEESGESYLAFSKHWQEWQRERGRKRRPATNLAESNLDHFLYGSTPDAQQFLKN